MSTSGSWFQKRWVIGGLVALLIISSAAYAAPVQAQGIPGCLIRITMFDTLFTRTLPSFGSPVAAQLAAGNIVCLIGRSGNAAWVQIVWPPEQGGAALGWAVSSAFNTTVPITVLPVTDGSTTPVTPPVVVTPPANAQTYVVRAGDTMFAISQRFGVSLAALIQANNAQPPYIIFIGQVLIIPGTGTATPPPGYTRYVVKPGEYLVSIARQFNLNWVTLATVNGIGFPYIIFPGQTLLIPPSG